MTPGYGACCATGTTLRLLRDSVDPGRLLLHRVRPTGPIFDGELFSDFVLLYLACHESRFAKPREEGGLKSCYLEQWRSFSAEQGEARPRPAPQGRRAGDRDPGHRASISHPANPQLRHPSRRTMSCVSTTSTARCCGWCTGCCSGSSPRTAAPCSGPYALISRSVQATSRSNASQMRTNLCGPAASARPSPADAAPAIPTSSRRSSSSSTVWVRKAASRSLPSPGIGGIFEPDRVRWISPWWCLHNQRGPAGRGPCTVPGQVPRGRRDAPCRLRQPRRRGARQCL